MKKQFFPLSILSLRQYFKIPESENLTIANMALIVGKTVLDNSSDEAWQIGMVAYEKASSGFRLYPVEVAGNASPRPFLVPKNSKTEYQILLEV